MLLRVEVCEQPIPRKLVITTKTLNSAPQYTLQVKGWKTGIRPAADALMFTPPAGARKLEPDALVELDELPPAAPTAASP